MREVDCTDVLSIDRKFLPPFPVSINTTKVLIFFMFIFFTSVKDVDKTLIMEIFVNVKFNLKVFLQ